MIIKNVLSNLLILSLFLFADKITAEDIRRVATRMLRCKPAVAGYGTLQHLPSYGDIEAALLTRDGKMSKRFSLFR